MKIVYLNTRLFLAGYEFLWNGNANSCDKCVIFQNNFIVGHAEKVYRFKKAGLWDVDTNSYYSNKTAKYLSFDNPDFYQLRATMGQEKDALATAFLIAFLLNRILILPCLRGDTILAPWFSPLSVLDEEILSADTNIGVDAYREHRFHDHRKVPNAVKSHSLR